MPLEHYRSQRDLRAAVGLVVPTWFPDDFPAADAAAVLSVALADLETVLEPRHCLVVADGSASAAEAARRLQQDSGAADGWELRLLEDGPHGKGGAVAHGLRELLERPELEWFLVRDHDGDHFLNDAPRLLRLALQIQAETGAAKILVNGGRSDLERPMGWVRAEYETVVNRLVWRSLHYHAARREAAVDELYLWAARPVPDLQSGYKLYTRAAAEAVAEASLAAEWPMRRWGCEVLSTVEIVADGGIYGEVQRATLDQQPLTTYEGGADRPRLHAGLIAWTAQRLEVPADVIDVWLEAAIAASSLRTTSEGREELLRLRAATADLLGGDPPRPQRSTWFC